MILYQVIIFGCLSLLDPLPLWAAQESAATPIKKDGTPVVEPSPRSNVPVQTDIDQPTILVAASSDEASARILLRNLDKAPAGSDFDSGLLTSSKHPHLLLRPTVELIDAVRVDNTRDYLAEIKVHGLMAFGDSSVPLLHKGRQVAVVRFSKPGLMIKPAVEGGFVLRAGSNLTLILENPSTFGYKDVRARLRFDNEDVCIFNAETFHTSSRANTQAKSKSEGFVSSLWPFGGNDEKRTRDQRNGCNLYESWTTIDIPRYAQVTLRAKPHSQWFLDADSNYARTGKRSGLLTLRFQTAATSPIHEQNLPLEVQMVPSNWSIFWGLLTVGFFLLLGALISLVLRVSVPNIKRKRQLQEQLNEAATLTAGISTEVDSNLRVLLRVERLVLDELRLTVGSFGPSYADYAQRVEQGLPNLKRRIEAVRRLDAALLRKRLLTEQGAAPTRLEQIENLLATVSETLKQDHLAEADWVFVNQRLESAEKTLREPTQSEKDAFEAMLAERWRMIKDHFGTDSTGALTVPQTLAGMETCFPHTTLLPDPKEDGSKWVKSVGPVRADLQLCALALLWEFQFLAPNTEPGTHWNEAKSKLKDLLATPAIDNLREAKSILRQLAEGITEDDICSALKNGDAMIIMDPSLPRPNQKIRFTVCFRQANLNTAAARELVTCRWNFRVQHTQKRHTPFRDAQISNTTTLTESGWYVHQYFERDAELFEIFVDFYDSTGKPIDIGVKDTETDAQHWSQLIEPIRRSRRSNEKRGRALIESFELIAALLVPLAALSSTAITGSSAAHWWELVAVGFGADTIKSILVGRKESSAVTQG
jgi:hypothetical protein